MKIDQTYEVVRIDGDHDPLKEHPQNPRLGDEEVIDESISVNGWYGAVVAQKATGYILAGNHRYRVAKKKGATEIPVIWKDVDDDTALKILLVDNKSADMGDYDEAVLEELLASLETLDGTGYILASAQEKIEEEAKPKEEVEPEFELDPDEIPDDVHTPQYGVMIVVESEEEQRQLYEWLIPYVEEKGEPGFENAKLRVVAV